MSKDPFLKFLDSIRGRKVHYFPNPGNAGDGFIAYATYELFKQFEISWTSHKQSDTAEADLVLVGGGGNLVEGRYNQVAEILHRHTHVRDLVLLPHTIVGFQDVLSFTHDNLTVFCREERSYEAALANGANPERTFLTQDITLFLKDDHFAEFTQPGSGILRSMRMDGEAAGVVDADPDNIDLSLSWNGDLWASAKFSEHVAKSLAAYISQYSHLQTDRLHLAIMGGFLKRDVDLITNSYFKNKSVYDHSLRSRFPGMRFAESVSDLASASSHGSSPTSKPPGGGGGSAIRHALHRVASTGVIGSKLAFQARRVLRDIASTSISRTAQKRFRSTDARFKLDSAAAKRLERLPFFSSDDYYAMHPDVAAAGMPASTHAALYGIRESRPLFRRHAIASVLARVTPDQGKVPAKSRPMSWPVRIYVSSAGNRFMKEIAEDLAEELRRDGTTVGLVDESHPIVSENVVNIFVAPHEFFFIGEGRERLKSETLRNSFVLNTEQVQTKWFALSLPLLLGARGVLDLSAQNSSIFREAGIPAIHWEPAPQEGEVWLSESDWDHPLVKLVGQERVERSYEWLERPIDVCFFGAESPRRQAALAQYAQPLSRFETYIYCRSEARGPIRLDDPLTRVAGFVASRSKISLNLHRDEFPYFEWHRIVRQGMVSGAVVVSDPCLPHPIWKPGIHYVEENLRHIPNVVEWLVKSADGRQKAEEIRSNASEKLRRRTGDDSRAAAFIKQVMGKAG